MIRQAQNTHLNQTGRSRARVGLQYARNAAMRLKFPAGSNGMSRGWTPYRQFRIAWGMVKTPREFPSQLKIDEGRENLWGMHLRNCKCPTLWALQEMKTSNIASTTVPSGSIPNTDDRYRRSDRLGGNTGSQESTIMGPPAKSGFQ
jgi:hypothetical protein